MATFVARTPLVTQALALGLDPDVAQALEANDLIDAASLGDLIKLPPSEVAKILDVKPAKVLPSRFEQVIRRVIEVRYILNKRVKNKQNSPT
jgi:hypothetical protein